MIKNKNDRGKLTAKLASNRGASLMMALVFFLLVTMVTSAVITSAALNVRRMTGAADEKQTDTAASSAIRLLRHELTPLTDGADTDSIFLRDVRSMAESILAGESTGRCRNYSLRVDENERIVTKVQLQVTETLKVRVIVKAVCGNSVRYMMLTYQYGGEEWFSPSVSDGGAEYLIGEM